MFFIYFILYTIVFYFFFQIIPDKFEETIEEAVNILVKKQQGFKCAKV